MELYLLRHGDAEPHASSEASRQLTLVGEDQAQRAGRLLHRLQASIKIVLSSPLVRARQTATFAAREMGSPEIQITEFLVPGTDQRQLIDQLNVLNVQSVCLVGHEPDLSTCISILISETRGASVMMQKGGLARVDIPLPIVTGRGILRWLVSPELVERL